MCGIFGYANYNTKVSVREILDILLGGLKQVEYRGYDSAGLCVDAVHESHETTAVLQKPAFVVRSVGNIDALRGKVFSSEVRKKIAMDAVLDNHVGIAHTRWATHGTVCERNCHPQQSNKGEFTIVHNGIMTNYMAVKQLLAEEGYQFASETDTEVICILAEYLYTKKNIRDLYTLAVKLTHFVEGAYAILLKSVHFPGQLIGARKGSPLLVGIRQTDAQGRPLKRNLSTIDRSLPLEVFLASDSNSFAARTSSVVYLEDGDIVQYGNGSLKIYSATDAEATAADSAVEREVQTLETTLESLRKGSYPHFMLKEIYEQAESVVSTMRGRVDFVHGGDIRLGGFTPQNVRNLLSSRRILLISCGTSMHSCMAVRPLFEELLPLPVSVENASDFLDRNPQIRRDDACFFVSQSGETADALMALKLCKDSGALCVGITNVVGSSISRLTDFGAHLNAGAEVGVASTKAYTSQVVLLTLVALLLSADAVHLQDRRKEIICGLEGLSRHITETLRAVAAPIEKLATQLKDAKSIIVLGRGWDYATAMEGALKVKELSYVHTEGINSGELKHGPLALVDSSMTVIALCPHDKHFEKAKAAVQQVNARMGSVFVVTTDADDAELNASATTVLALPKTVDALQCILNVLPFQLLAYNMALMRGNNVDCPRNLAKSVTVQ